jgi:hypothetical protein
VGRAAERRPDHHPHERSLPVNLWCGRPACTSRVSWPPNGSARNRTLRMNLGPKLEPTPAACQTVAGGRTSARARPPETVVRRQAHPGGMSDVVTLGFWHPLRGAFDLARGAGGRRPAATSGYRLGRLGLQELESACPHSPVPFVRNPSPGQGGPILPSPWGRPALICGPHEATCL